MTNAQTSETVQAFTPPCLDTINLAAGPTTNCSVDLPSESSTTLSAQDYIEADGWSFPQGAQSSEGQQPNFQATRKQYDDVQRRLNVVHSNCSAAFEQYKAANHELQEFHLELSRSMWPMVDHPRGTRIIQQALDMASAEERKVLALGLKGHVNEAWRSSNAIFVLQTCISLMPPSAVEFIIGEMLDDGSVVEAAQNSHGIRVLQRLIEHGLESRPMWLELVNEIIDNSAALVHHKYGNFVLQSVLEHGTQGLRRRLTQKLLQDLPHNIANRYGSYVLQSALQHADDPELQMLVDSLIEHRKQMKDGMAASFVFKFMHQLPRVRERISSHGSGKPDNIIRTGANTRAKGQGRGSQESRAGKRVQRWRHGPKGGPRNLKGGADQVAPADIFS